MMLATIAQTQAHESLKYLSNLVVFDFVNNDGTGSTLSLLVAALIFGKSTRYRSLAKIAVGPNVFGINEPVIFGLPIMFNAIMVIPFVCSTLISASIAWLAVKIHFITTINASILMSMPWTLPKFVTSFFAYGWQGVVLRIIIFVVLIILYLPFFRILDQQEMKKELEAEN